MVKKILIPVNEKGFPVGEKHHNAKLSDVEVELMRDLYEEGLVGYRTLARFFGVPRHTVVGICNYYRRVGTVDKYKPVYFGENGKRVKSPSGMHNNRKM